jgi:hypothetical protein
MEFWLKGKSRLGDYLFAQFVEYYRESTRKQPQPYPWSKVIWDISTVAWMVNPRWIPSALVPSPVLTDDLRYEKRPGRHSIRVATNVQRDAVYYDLFTRLAKVG